MDRFYDRIRHPSAAAVADAGELADGFDHLRGHKYCLLATHKRSGELVPTPVWFGLADGNVYVRTEANAAKVRRIRNNPEVLVAPSTVRGKPRGPAAAGRARVLEQPEDLEIAEGALMANYGIGRRLYERFIGDSAAAVYLEVMPAMPGAR
jgi:PPOX class probable F420-dependent enzyme